MNESRNEGADREAPRPPETQPDEPAASAGGFRWIDRRALCMLGRLQHFDERSEARAAGGVRCAWRMRR